MFAGGASHLVEWMRSKGHGLKTHYTAASGAVQIMNLEREAARAYQVPARLVNLFSAVIQAG